MKQAGIPYLDLGRVNAMHMGEIAQAADAVVRSGWYLKGAATEAFEREWAGYLGSPHCVACGNGLDALTLIFRAYMELGRIRPGSKVVVPANTYIASILSITENGLEPVLVEPDPATCQIDSAKAVAAIEAESAGGKVAALLAVHLYGIPAYDAGLWNCCKKNGVLIIEDNAQAHGCLVDTDRGLVRTGSLGDAAAHSFYPGKNLGALGDAGAVTTGDGELAAMVRTLGNYGSERKYVFSHKGVNSRMDEIQAAVLSAKLRHLDADNRRRREIAEYYDREISHPFVYTLPPKAGNGDRVHHIYPVFCDSRDMLQRHLAAHGVGSLVHYPVPPHKQAAYKEWNGRAYPVTERLAATELSLPLHPALADCEVERVVEVVNTFLC